MDKKEDYKRTRSEILAELETILMFMKTNMDLMASGKREFFKQLATNIRVVCHQTRNSHSVLNQLEIQDKIQMISSSHEYSQTNLIPHTGLLTQTVTSNGAFYNPKRGSDDFHLVTFNQWWDEEIILSNKNKETWTRKSVVLHVADKEGGAHLDQGIPAEFHDVSYKNGLGWKFFKGSKSSGTDLENPIPATLWQIGFEIAMSIERFKRLNS